MAIIFLTLCPVPQWGSTWAVDLGHGVSALQPTKKCQPLKRLRVEEAPGELLGLLLLRQIDR